MNIVFTGSRQFANGIREAAEISGMTLSGFVRKALIRYCTQQYQQAVDNAAANRKIIELQRQLKKSLADRKVQDPNVYEDEKALAEKAEHFEETAELWQGVLEKLLMSEEYLKDKKAADEEEEEEE